MPATTATPPLALDTIIPLATKLAAREARSPSDIEDLTQVALFAYHRAATSYVAKRIKLDRPWAFAKTTLVRAMRLYYQQQGWYETSPLVFDISDATAGDYAKQHCGHAWQSLAAHDTRDEFDVLADYFTAVERECGELAHKIATQLFAPHSETAAAILHMAKRKQAGAGSTSIRGVKHTVRISQRVIRDAMGIPPKRWQRELASLREFTRVWLAAAA